MSEEETLAVLEQTRARLPRTLELTPEELWKLWVIRGPLQENERLELSGGEYPFSAWTLENSCRVHKPTDGPARLECFGAETRPILEQCVVILSGAGGRIQCLGPDQTLRRLSHGSGALTTCGVIMENSSYGRLTCY